MVNRILPYIDKYPISEECFTEVLNRLKSVDKSSGQQVFYSRFLNKVDPCLIDKYKHEIIEIISQGKKKESKITDMYAKLCHDKLDVLINKLEELIKELEEQRSYDRDKFFYGKKIVKAVADKRNLQREDIKQIINEEKNNDLVSYKLIFMVTLAGQLKMEELISPMVDLFATRLEDDVLIDEITEALIKIGSDKVVEAVKPYILDFEVGPFAIDIMKNIKTPAAEEALLSSFMELEDSEDKTRIANALCQLLSVKAIPVIESFIEEGYVEWLLDLEESLYCNCLINNIDHPKLSEWKG